MRVLILSCNTGEGHNAAAKAMLERIREQGHEADMVDIMLLASKRTSKWVGGCYVWTVNHVPRVFSGCYKLGDAISASTRKSPVYWANTFMAKHLQKYLQQHPYDLIVTPHLFPAETATYMKKHHMLKQKVVAISTDYTCIPFWEETDCDYYIIPHKDLLKEYQSKGVPKQKLIPLGIPVGLSFGKQKEKPAARRACGLPAHSPAFLVMGGSMGFGNISAFARELAKRCTQGEQIVIICGNNQKVKEHLQGQLGQNPNVHIVGFTRQVADYMDACDVIFTKPGGLSSTEAGAKRIPIVHTPPIPGCETKNMQFFQSRGMAVCPRSMQEQIEQGMRLMYDQNAASAMRKAQQKHIDPTASLEIFRFLQSIVE